MFYYLNGILTYLFDDAAVIDCNGVGYYLTISAQTRAKLISDGAILPTGEIAEIGTKLYTYHNIKEDVSELYGFYTVEECELFKLLISVSGIGPKAGIAILSALSVGDFVYAVLREDARIISSAQGVGLKTAQKVIIELKDKVLKRFSYLGNDPQDSSSSDRALLSDIQQEAIDALLVLGYSKSESSKAVRRSEGKTVEDIIRSSLKLLMK